MRFAITPRLVVEAAYVVAVTGVAARGFATESTAWILAGFALALPAGMVAVGGYYLVYGLLAMLPGTQSTSASGSASCTADGICTQTSAADTAAWFAFTTDLVGVLAATAAAVVNVALLRLLTRSRRADRGCSTGSTTPGTAPRRSRPA